MLLEALTLAAHPGLRVVVLLSAAFSCLGLLAKMAAEPFLAAARLREAQERASESPERLRMRLLGLLAEGRSLRTLAIAWELEDVRPEAIEAALVLYEAQELVTYTDGRWSITEHGRRWVDPEGVGDER